MDGVDDLLHIFGGERYMLTFTPARGGGGDSRSSGDAVDGATDGTSNSSTIGRRGRASRKGTASIILHRDATGADTVKALLALEYFRQELVEAGIAVAGVPNHSKKRKKKGQGEVSTAAAPAATTTATATAGIPINGDGSQVINGDLSRAVADAQVGDRARVSAAASRGEGVQQGSTGARYSSSTVVLRCLEAARRRADQGLPGFFEALAALGWDTEKFMFGNIASRVEWRL